MFNSVYSYHVMVKSVSCCCVEGSWLFSNPKTLANLLNYRQQFYSNSPSFLLIFTTYFHNIPYANGLQFVNVFSTKLPTVLICQSLLLYGSTYSYNIIKLHAIVDQLKKFSILHRYVAYNYEHGE